MKEGFDREIDSLLRRRARGTAESRSWGDGSQDTHLDADELGAFAEGALPTAARLAAASHLADCERCRGVVVGLARVPGATAEATHHAVPAAVAAESAGTPAWRALLASLFAPRVMRFAVPVLALSLVGVVSYVALRSNRSGATETASNTRRQDSAARSEPSAAASPAVSSANANQSGLTDVNANAAPSGSPAAAVQPNEPRGHGAADAKTSEAEPAKAEEQPSAAAPPPPPPAPPAAAEGPAEMSKAAPRPVTTEEGEVARNDSRDKSENKDKSARQSEPSDELAANDAAQRGRAAQSRMNQAQMPDGGARNEKRAADSNASGVYGGGNAAASAPAKESDRERAGSRSEAVGSKTRTTRRPEKKADEDETASAGDTRAAAGHRFRREGGAWVDVNYKPSMPSTGVRRGTDSFRALVADVPEVGRVAEAVGGEVIVVVGGRAYRVH